MTTASSSLVDRWHASAIYQALLRGRAPRQFLPLSLPGRRGDPERGTRLVAGGATHIAADDFDSFDWLGDLAAVGGSAAATRAHTLLSEWLAARGPWQPAVWTPGLTARRLIAALVHAQFLLDGSPDAIRHSLTAVLVKHARHLAYAAGRARPGVDAVAAANGLLFAGLCGFGERCYRRGVRLLKEQVDRQVLPDGGHVQRSPGHHLLCLQHLLDARAALSLRQRDVPSWLESAIGQMVPVLRMLRHATGELALFNGTGHVAAGAVDGALAQSRISTGAPVHAPSSGFIRLAAGRLAVVVDVGAPPPAPYDTDAHAGTLSFEMTHGSDRIIVNCGAQPIDTWRQVQRATAAHSTLVLADINSSEIISHGIGRRPANVRAHCETADNAFWLETSHDGYAPSFGVVHRRRLYVGADGDDCRGEDTLTGAAAADFAIRFHLHPDVQASLLQNAAAVLLRAKSGTAWRFQAANANLSVSESVYLGGPGPMRRTDQVVLSGTHGGAETTVKWALRRID